MGIFTDLFKNNPLYKWWEDQTTEDEKKLEEELDKFSVGESEKALALKNNDDYNYSYGAAHNANKFSFNSDFNNKTQKILKYREMSKYPEISEVLESITQESIVEDHEGKFSDLFYPNEVPDNVRKIAREEYEYVMNVVFNSKKNIYKYFKNFLVDGELFLEMIRSEKEGKDVNIIGLNQLPSFNVQPLYDTDKYITINGFGQLKQTNKNESDSQNIIPFKDKQISYINYGNFDPKMEVLGFLDSSVRTYNQLKILEDSLVVYRVSRSPERKVFSVEVGKMPPAKQEAYVKKMARNFKSKVTYNSDTGSLGSTQNTMSISDDYFFAQNEGKGTRIEQLPGASNLGEIGDIQFFLTKLYKSLQFPRSRYDSQFNTQYVSSREISRDELKFSKFIERLQQKFKPIIMQVFKTQFKLRCEREGISEEYYGKNFPKYFDIRYFKNNLYSEFREIEFMETKINVFASMEPYILSVNNPDGMFSQEYVLKKFFRMTNEEYKENKDKVEDERKYIKKNVDDFSFGTEEEGENDNVDADSKNTDKQSNRDSSNESQGYNIGSNGKTKKEKRKTRSKEQMNEDYKRLYMNNT